MSDREDEECTNYGSALPPISNDEPVRKKPLRLEEQIVTDENGRRRFHGAFTGGFSAGFFNTAGSRDGWAPKSFKSTRKDVPVERALQKPEDFMDAEDIGGFGFAPQGLKTNLDFSSSSSGSRKRPISESVNGIIPGDPVLDHIFRPVKDSIGVLLLKGMGWKEGKGIGPKLRKSRKKALKKSVKSLVPSEDPQRRCLSSSDDDDDYEEKYKDFLFAPDDIPQFVATPKSNSFGIGYKGLSGHINLFGGSEHRKPSINFRTKSGNKGSIRGQAFGVGAYEEDDEDIYGGDNMNRYDFSLSVVEDSPVKERKKKSRWEEIKEEELVIEGFCKALSKFSFIRTVYKAPEIPKDFQPRIIRKSRFEPDSKTVCVQNPTPNDRKAALAPVVVEKPIEEEVSKEYIEEIQALVSKNTHKSSTLSERFKPFTTDPLKQKRYEDYLVCVRNGRRNGLKVLQKASVMAEWEKEREKLEFERAEALYRPLANNMACRFVSSNEETSNQKASDSSSDVEKASANKLYGKLTRVKEEWHPAKLLCIRFNVKHPYTGDDSCVGVRPSKKLNIFAGLPESSNQEVAKQIDSMKEETIEQPKVSENTQTSKIELEEEPLEEKPPMNLFKSIFLDSDDSESDKETEEKVETPPPKSPPPSSKVPTGVFANIDFDSLNAKPKSNFNERKDKLEPKSTNYSSSSDEADDLAFGPAKPPTSSTIGASYKSSKSSEEENMDEWTERKSSSREMPKKKKKKKSKKKQKKYKKKKAKKRRSSSSSSSE